MLSEMLEPTANSSQPVDAKQGNPIAGGDVEHVAQHTLAANSAPHTFEEIRGQESVFILLNLSILAALVVIHVLFQSQLGRPSVLIIGLLAGRFAWQALELVWLLSLTHPLSPILTRLYAVGAVVLHLAFAITASLASGLEHSHYVVLFVLPTIAAAFRFGWTGTVVITLIASLNTLLEVRVHYARFPVNDRIAEQFEAATVVLVYAAVAIFVHLIARQLRKKQRTLERSLRELAEARDQLVEQEKLGAIGRLSAGIAHEVRNPVAMITSAVTTAKRCGYKPPVRDEMCAIIEKESQRLAKLTDDFLSYARQKPPQPEVTSIRTTLEYVCSLARPRAEELEVDVSVRLDEDFASAFDAFQIHQVLLNLALNAVEAAGAQGQVVMTAEPQPPHGVVFRVSNTGDAIEEASVAQLFEPFFTTKTSGTGLGLAIAEKIATAHGGSLQLAQNQAGRVEFTLSLPGGGNVAPHKV